MKLYHGMCRPCGALDIADVAAVEEALSDAGAVVDAAMKGASFGPTEQVHPVPTFCICCLPNIELHRGMYLTGPGECWAVVSGCPAPQAGAVHFKSRAISSPHC